MTISACSPIPAQYALAWIGLLALVRQGRASLETAAEAFSRMQEVREEIARGASYADIDKDGRRGWGKLSVGEILCGPNRGDTSRRSEIPATCCGRLSVKYGLPTCQGETFPRDNLRSRTGSPRHCRFDIILLLPDCCVERANSTPQNSIAGRPWQLLQPGGNCRHLQRSW